MIYSWILFLVIVSIIMSYLMASLFWGKGTIPECFMLGNWSIGTGIIFLLCEFLFGYFIYLQGSGQMPTLLDVLFP
ncbi:hypothetical protein SRABI13_04362 [Erwinia aphidicola]|nr:hypothetical protein SRABI13_04362 [Erwinia aphidicola]